MEPLNGMVVLVLMALMVMITMLRVLHSHPVFDAPVFGQLPITVSPNLGLQLYSSPARPCSLQALTPTRSKQRENPTKYHQDRSTAGQFWLVLLLLLLLPPKGAISRCAMQLTYYRHHRSLVHLIRR